MSSFGLALVGLGTSSCGLGADTEETSFVGALGASAFGLGTLKFSEPELVFSRADGIDGVWKTCGGGSDLIGPLTGVDAGVVGVEGAREGTGGVGVKDTAGAIDGAATRFEERPALRDPEDRGVLKETGGTTKESGAARGATGKGAIVSGFVI